MNFEKQSRSYEKEFIQNVSKLLVIPSIYEEDKNYPYGKPIHEALTTMLNIGKEDGFKVKDVDGHAGHIEFGEGEEVIGILGHLDVVPPGEGWSTEPFTPELKDGKLYARGAQDDKGPVVAAYMAMKLLKNEGFQPKKKVRLILGTDEERDWKGIEHYFSQEEMPVFGFSPDAAFPVIHAEKGLIDGYFTFSSNKPSAGKEAIELISIEAGDRLNMVPDYAEAILSTSKDIPSMLEGFLSKSEADGKTVVKEGRFHVSIEGKSVHPSKPAQGVNAIVELLRFLKDLPIKESLLFQSLYSSFSSTSGEQAGLALQDNVSGSLTLNLGSLTYSTPSSLKLGINLRYPVTERGEDVIKLLQQIADNHEGSFELYDHLAPLYVEKDHPYVETLMNVYNKTVTNKAEPVAIGGATYARVLETGVAFGALFEESPDTAHQKDEHVRIKDMVKSIAIYADAIYQLTK
ncbi:dipeptidase PepV [Halobacillus salinarum]|uniref:Dipeptidase PepV n=1 Tax=Halobacillus salinarum TaxID=2932257 RepID=A0ABY4ENS2_9BACI|nr:dipeptidase PepV [Halobacillus salinarum]UOQ46103.1 dipeptidase PepV [Halobacillus salinarum]